MDLLSTASCEQRPPWHLQQRGLVMLYIFQWRRCLAEESAVWKSNLTPQYNVFLPRLDRTSLACGMYSTWITFGWMTRKACTYCSFNRDVHLVSPSGCWPNSSQDQAAWSTLAPVLGLLLVDYGRPLLRVPRGPDQTLPPKLPWDRRRNYSRRLRP